MGITVAQALKFGGLAQGILLAGERNLANVIESVSIMEAPAKPAWNMDHGLFITCFYALKGQPEGQIAAIKTLTNQGCAALVFQTGILDELSPDVICCAEEVGLPLIQVPERVTYPDIITPLVGALLEEKTYLLQRSEEIHRRLTDLCLSGGGVQAIASALNELVKQPVVIMTAWGDLVTAAGFEDSLPLNLDWILNANLNRQTAGPLPIYCSPEGVWTMKLFSGEQRESDGYILVIDPAHSLTPLDLIAIEQASIVTALEMVKERAVLETERRLDRDFFENILNPCENTAEVILSKAHSLGWELEDKHVIGLVHIDWDVSPSPASAVFDEPEIRDLKNRALRTIIVLAKEHHPKDIVIDQDEHIILLPHCEESDSPTQHNPDLQAFGENVISRLQPLVGGRQITMAYGGTYHSLGELRISYDEARLALSVCPHLMLRNQPVWYADVALYVLLERIARQPETLQWFKRTLGKLVDYDRVNGTDLVRTLEAYFDNNQMLQQSAYHLFIHSKTLKYRLRRIEEILGTDPFLPGQQLNYYVACKLACLLDLSALG